MINRRELTKAVALMMTAGFSGVIDKPGFAATARGSAGLEAIDET